MDIYSLNLHTFKTFLRFPPRKLLVHSVCQQIKSSNPHNPHIIIFNRQISQIIPHITQAWLRTLEPLQKLFPFHTLFQFIHYPLHHNKTRTRPYQTHPFLLLLTILFLLLPYFSPPTDPSSFPTPLLPNIPPSSNPLTESTKKKKKPLTLFFCSHKA